MLVVLVDIFYEVSGQICGSFEIQKHVVFTALSVVFIKLI